MSLFLDVFGNHPVEVECMNCHRAFDSKLSYFYDDLFPLFCPSCGHKIDTNLKGQAVDNINQIKEALDKADRMLNKAKRNIDSLGKLKIKQIQL